jgi:hypothetical protein
MNQRKTIWVGCALAVLTYGSALVFMAFDRTSHSASDTIRPFLITVAPLWALAFASSRILLRG